jgi:exodeoxyribonuclease-3
MTEHLRIVVWNANMALDRKLDALADLHPDLAIIPECANVEILTRKVPQHLFQMVWIGRQPNKGLGIIAFGGYTIELHPSYDERLEWIAPVEVAGPHPFLLLGAWCTRNPGSSQGPWRSYRQIQPALELYRELISLQPTIVAGDFNNNVTWDRPGRSDNFPAMVDVARSAGLLSAYHTVNEAPFGTEPHPTLYWRDRAELGPRYHVDFCFIPREWVPYTTSVTVGDFATWVGSGLSDHVPLVVEIELPD